MQCESDGSRSHRGRKKHIHSSDTAAANDASYTGARLVHFAGGLVFGGVEQAILTTLRGLDRRRWRPLLMHYDDAEIGPLLDGAHAAGIRTCAIGHSRSRTALRMARIARALARENPVIFHAHLPLPQYCRVPLAAAAIARVPAIVATAHLFQPFSSSLQAMYQGVLNGRIDRYVAVSADIASQLRDVLRIPAHKITVIRNGVPLERFARTAEAVELPDGGRSPGGLARVLTLARLHPQKGLVHLIEAACLVPEAEFLIAGDGPQRAELEAKARALGVSTRVRFLGHRSDVSTLLQTCDVFVLPSLFEGLPLAVLEAMAAGRPIVASDVSGVREAIVHRETGLLVPAARADELARAIRLLISQPTLARRLGEQARRVAAREFSADVMVQRIGHLYDELERS
jgi:glycosyltransferase involved in cell wall biosynthesis